MTTLAITITVDGPSYCDVIRHHCGAGDRITMERGVQDRKDWWQIRYALTWAVYRGAVVVDLADSEE